MAKSKIVLFGSSGHAKVILDIIENTKDFELLGFIDTHKNIGEKILGYKVIGDEQSLPRLMVEYNFNQGIIGIGDNFIRSKITNIIKKLVQSFQFVNCIHKSANISKHCELGVGNVIMPGVTINTGTIISNHCILNTNSSIDHDCKMNDFSSLAPNSVVGGNSSVGEFSNVGIGASVFHGIHIEKNCIIGGGSVVNRNTLPNSIYYGVPAKFISKRNDNDKYL